MRYLFLAVGTILWVVADQVSKFWVVRHLVFSGLPDQAHDIESARFVVFDSWFALHVVGNKGAAWGLFRNLPESWRVPFFLAISVIAVVAIVLFFRRTQEHQVLLRVALTFILGGALGNLADRIRLGYVVDFIDWHYRNVYHWPTFNVADVAISTGVGLLLLDMLLHRGAARAKSESPEIP
jgi:signal peptidase II